MEYNNFFKRNKNELKNCNYMFKFNRIYDKIKTVNLQQNKKSFSSYIEVSQTNI